MRGKRGPFIVPILLVVGGGALLLENFGFIGSIRLLQFWPVLLMLAGLQLVARGDIGISWQYEAFGITRGTVNSAALEASAGELDIKIRALRRQGRLIAGQYTARSRAGLDVRGDHARVVMERGHTWPFSHADWEIGLAKDLPWAMLLSAHLGELDVDLRGLQISRAELATGIGDIKVIAADGPMGNLRVRSSLGNVTLIIPAEAGAIIRIPRQPFARVVVDENRFIQLEPGLYATLDYDRHEQVLYAEAASTFGMVRLQQAL